MTIYTLDLLQPASLSRLWPARKVPELSLHICSNIIAHLSVVLAGHPPVMPRTIAHLNADLQRHMGVLGMAMSDRTDIPYRMRVIGINVVRRVSPITSLTQAFTMSTLSKVHPRILVELISKLLENSLLCMRPHLCSLPVTMVNEYTGKIIDILYSLFLIMNNKVSFLQPGIAAAIITVEFKDDVIEVRDLCVTPQEILSTSESNTPNLVTQGRPVTLHEFL
jgi:hypothetical protein